jgi:hypothetical protein
MKLNTAKSIVTTAHSLDVTKATIELNSTTIHVLSRDLYSRPVHAVLREILTNAIDAHIEAGVTRPVDIKLPTIWDEHYYVRDYGLGLDVPSIKGIYLSYGKSTRRDSDVVHGGFGLGTKSPLAYTTAFTVTSYHGGQEHIFIVYYDQDNLPCLDHRESNLSNEPSGLKVSLVAANSSDYLRFQEAAKAVLPRVPPELYNLVDSDVEGWAPNGFVMPEGHIYGPLVLRNQRSFIHVVMGCVAYEINTDAVLKYLKNLGNNKISFVVDDHTFPAERVIQALTNSGSIEINAKIGDYPIHPSREYVNVTPRAVKQLCADIQMGITAMHGDIVTSKPKFSSDVAFYSITGIVPADRKDTVVRARFIQPSHYSYVQPRIPKQTTTYGELVIAASENRRTLVIGSLTTENFTTYLGNGRSTYNYPAFVPSDQSILFFDNQRSDAFLADMFVDLSPLDFEEEIKNWVIESDSARTAASLRNQRVYIPRAVTRSMQDPKHNVLILSSGIGTQKKNWASDEHNVTSILEMKRPVFWTPTRMGCLENPGDVRDIISRFMDMRAFIPVYKLPIILGLPASRGTLAFQKAFKPITELEQWMTDYMTSPSVVRKIQLKKTADVIYGDINVHALYELRVYGPIDKLFRLADLAKRYHIAQAPVTDSSAKLVAAHDVTLLMKDVCAKFPVLKTYNYGWGRSNNVEEYVDWAGQLAVLTNDFSTSAKYKNAKS